MFTAARRAAPHLLPTLRAAVAPMVLAATCIVQPASASFVTYVGGLQKEAEWQAAALPTQADDFQSYAVGQHLSSLPALGIQFQELEHGGFPTIYDHFFEANVTPYGSLHLGNFPKGIVNDNRYDDMVGTPTPGVHFTAMGFWNGDGQADTMVLSAFDCNGALLGTVGAFKGSFAGFVSSANVCRFSFEGRTGDGLDHIDNLQTNARPTTQSVSSPATIWLIVSATAALLLRRKPQSPRNSAA